MRRFLFFKLFTRVTDLTLFSSQMSMSVQMIMGDVYKNVSTCQVATPVFVLMDMSELMITSLVQVCLHGCVFVYEFERYLHQICPRYYIADPVVWVFV